MSRSNSTSEHQRWRIVYEETTDHKIKFDGNSIAVGTTYLLAINPEVKIFSIIKIFEPSSNMTQNQKTNLLIQESQKFCFFFIQRQFKITSF